MEPVPVFRDPAQPVDVALGQVFTIRLESNPSTGYQWQLAQPVDESIVKLEGSEYQPPATVLPGAGGTEAWTFRAVGQGETSIALKYIRPWEKETPPAEQQTFAVVVHQ
ncbi:MAG TPA: protease inhibitor I42 family protein [Herpetosiphonaceae bacterium]